MRKYDPTEPLTGTREPRNQKAANIAAIMTKAEVISSKKSSLGWP